MIGTEARLDELRGRVAAEITRKHRRRYRWGDHDCIAVAEDISALLTGNRVGVRGLLGAHGENDAERVMSCLRRHGTLENAYATILPALGFRRSKLSTRRRAAIGDVAIFRGDLSVHTGRESNAASPAGEDDQLYEIVNSGTRWQVLVFKLSAFSWHAWDHDGLGPVMWMRGRFDVWKPGIKLGNRMTW